MAKSGKKTGRPTKMTPEVITTLENAYSLGCSDVEACGQAGISRETLYEYQRRNPKFVDRKAYLKEKLILMSRQVVATEIKRGDKDTAKWYLERKAKKEFSTKVETDITQLKAPTFVDDVPEEEE